MFTQKVTKQNPQIKTRVSIPEQRENIAGGVGEKNYSQGHHPEETES